MFKKIMHHVWHSRWERFYSKSHWHLVLDLSLLIVIIFLVASLFTLYFYRPALNWFGGFTQSKVDLDNPPLELDFSVASSTLEKDGAAILKISFKNNGSAVITDAVIDLATTNKNFTLNQIKAVDNSPATINGRQVILTPIKAADSGEVELAIYFKIKETTERTIDWQAQSQYFFDGHLLKETVALPSLTLKAQLRAEEAAYYTSPQGDQLGIGPIPPLAGLPTDYWIFWEAEGSDSFKNVVFSAYLPQGLELTERRSLLAGDFTYNAASRQIVWKIKELTGRSDSYRLSFEVRLIPTTEQIGKVLPLLVNPRYYAEDALTGEESKGALNQLTTNLENDQFIQGRGEVVGQ